MLALSGLSGISADSLAAAVFGDQVDARSNGTLQVHLCQLRAQLKPYQDCIARVGATYRLDPALVRTDVAALENGLSACRAGRVDGTAILTAAARTWCGELCADLPDLHALAAPRAHYRELHFDAQEILFAAELRSGAGADLPERIEWALAGAPLRERLWAQLMMALYAVGRQTAALSAYQRARRLLALEVGVEPGVELRELEGRILRQSSTLDIAAPSPVDAEDHAVVWLDAAGIMRTAALLPGTEITVGRAAECSVRIDWDPAVSRRHASFTLLNNRCTVRDLGSHNGTIVDGVAIDGTSVLPATATIQLGDSVLMLRGPRHRMGPVDSRDVTRHHVPSFLGPR
jgi:DNA-binding SARP family transcriptional activator